MASTSDYGCQLDESNYILQKENANYYNETDENISTGEEVQDYGERETNRAGSSSNLEPFIGKEFETEEEAYNFYNEYAKITGFSIRRGNSYRSRAEGQALIGKVYCCSKQGQRPYNGIRPSSREGCSAHMAIKISGCGRWVIHRLEKVHCHQLETPSKISLLRSQKYISEIDREMITTLDEANISPAEIMSVMKNQLGGAAHMTFSKSDCKNFIYGSRNHKKIPASDASLLIGYFARKQAENAGFFYSIEVDSESMITTIFWAEARCRMSYHYFGDVITFDTTYKTNKNDMPFAVFIGVNHHKQSIMFACALMMNETEESFIWVFNTFIQAMFKKHPESIITDQDPAMELAISQVFPHSRHRYCKWHITRKFPEKLGKLASNHPDLQKDFFDCIDRTETQENFEECWQSFIEKYNLHDHTWLQSLYLKRQKWVNVYLQDVFFAKMTTTQRSESFNALLDRYVKKDTCLYEFPEKIEKLIDDRCRLELEENYKSNYTRPVLTYNMALEEHAADIYTGKMFLEFKEELGNVFRQQVVEIIEEGGSQIYFKVGPSGSKKLPCTVKWNSSENIVACSCQLFEYCGILCRHALKVLIRQDVLNIPAHYIKKRWTKEATIGDVFDDNGTQIRRDCKESNTLRYNNLVNKALRLAAEGATPVEVYDVAVSVLQKGIEDIRLKKRNIQAVQSCASNTVNGEQQQTFVVSQNDVAMSHISVRDPPQAKPKGRKADRLKPWFEEQRTKERRCVVCRQPGHDRRNCDKINLAHNDS